MVYSVDIPKVPALFLREMENRLYGGEWSGGDGRNEGKSGCFQDVLYAKRTKKKE